MASIKVLFYLRKSKTNRFGSDPIYMRVTVSGDRFETATSYTVDPAKWSQKSCRVIGNNKEAKELNNLLDALRAKVYDIQKTLLLTNQEITKDVFGKLWFGVKEPSKMLLGIFKEHNEQIKALINIQYSLATYKKYLTTFDHTANFIRELYNKTDIAIEDIKYKFITDFEFWLKTKKKCNQNSTVKYLTNFKKIIHICTKNGWLLRDPFAAHKMIKEDTQRPYLTSAELDILHAKDFSSERLRQVRDIFLFSCYTGLAYIDTQKLTYNEIVTGIDGEKWIITTRQKTEAASRIPLLPTAIAILGKYKDHPACIVKNRALPILSNQKMNEYLHEIATICGINKKMTYHTARHTFATTVTLTNGVPIETVSKMLGHRNLKTTQHYAKIVDTKISEDMKALKYRMQQEISK
jgi:site-specific recombinase XerD